MAVVDELVTILGVKLDSGALNTIKAFENRIKDVAKGIKMLGLAATAAASATGLFINRAINQAAEIEKLADKTGLSTTALQEWSYAAGQVGADSQNIQQDLVRLQKKYVGTGKTSEEVLLKMADDFSKLSAASAKQKGAQFGLSDDTILLLRRGREGIEELKKQAHKLGGVIDPVAIKRAAQFKKSLDELKFSFKGFTSALALSTVPTLEKVTNAFKDWIEANKEWIRLKFEDVILGVKLGLDDFFELLKKGKKFFDPIIEKIKEWTPEMTTAERVTHLVRGALLLLTVILAPLLVKWGLIAAAVALAIVVFDDIFEYLKNGGGVIGRFVKKVQELYKENKILADFLLSVVTNLGLYKIAVVALPKVVALAKAATLGFAGAFKALNATLKANVFVLILSLLVALAFALYENWDAVKEWAGKVGHAMAKVWLSIKYGASVAWEAIKKWASGSVDYVKEKWEGLKAWFKNFWETIKSYIPDFKAYIPDFILDKLGSGAQQAAAAAPMVDQVRVASGRLGGGGMFPGMPAGQQTTLNDNKTQNFHIVAPDPMSAANQVANIDRNVSAGIMGIGPHGPRMM